jgi:hypothetical protein
MVHVNDLKMAMLKVIEEEQLPMPKKIMFRYPMKQNRKSLGRCIKNKISNEFKITLTMTTPVFVLDENGAYRNRRTGQRYSKSGIQHLTEEQMINTASHEIAHLKYWNHNSQHQSYTNYIIQKIKLILGGEANEI